jgi:hypothetical protein
VRTPSPVPCKATWRGFAAHFAVSSTITARSRKRPTGLYREWRLTGSKRSTCFLRHRTLSTETATSSTPTGPTCPRVSGEPLGS